MTVFSVVAWLTLHNCSLAGAAGITANFVAEANLNPAAVGSGVGLPQYAGSRRRLFLAALGPRWRDGYAQLEYVRREAGAAWTAACAMADPGMAAAVWMRMFERPRSRDPRRRVMLARSIYAEMTR